MNAKPAFPTTEIVDQFNDATGKWEPKAFPVGGLSQRELFAALMMPAVYIGRLMTGLGDTQESIADEACDLADSLVEALGKSST